MRLLLLGLLGAALALFPLIAKAEETLAISAIPPPPVVAPPVAAAPPGDIPAPGPAAPVAMPGVQDVIKAQLIAIRTRDAAAAHALMTPDSHTAKDDSKTFFSKMRFTQRALYNHEDYTFLENQSTGDVSLQKVRINDHYGAPVMVIYRLERQASGHWLIDSYTILETDAQPI